MLLSVVIWATLVSAAPSSRTVVSPVATRLIVTSTGDSGAGSLRQAIGDASSGDTISFSVTGIITLTSGELVLDKDLIIEGPGSGDLTISGNNVSRVFNVTSDQVAVAVSALRILHGNVMAEGGGVLNSGTLILTNITITNSTAFYSSGGILNSGRLTIENSTISNNTTLDAAGGGGGIWNSGAVMIKNSTISNNAAGGRGGGIYNSTGTLAITNSTVRRNVAGASGGIHNSSGTLTVTRSTISDNAIFSFGATGGILNSGTLTLTNSTVSNNTATQGGGIYNVSPGTVTLTNTTVRDNVASTGGGIFNAASLTLTNSIIAGNGSPMGPDCVGPITSMGHNLIGNTSGCNLTPGTGDLVNVDPLVGPLQNNGGATFTGTQLDWEHFRLQSHPRYW